MSAGLIILLLYQDGYNYDNFHTDPERIFRINTIEPREKGSTEPFATTSGPLNRFIQSKFSWIELSTSLVVFEEEMVSNNQRFSFKGKITDSNFLKIFNFQLEHGDATTVLNTPNSIVLSNELSKKLFKDENPVNKTIQIGTYGLFKISGVLRPFPGKTHFEFDALISSVQPNEVENWQNYYSTYTYIKVKPNINREESIAEMNDLVNPIYKNLSKKNGETFLKLDLQSLNEITPGYSIAHAMGKGLPRHLLLILAFMGVVVMISSMFNYTNLTLAKALGRMKEIGVRKVLGANRTHIVMQVMCEGIVISMIALLIACLFMHFFKSELSKLQVVNFFDLNLHVTSLSLVYFVLFAFLVGIAAGALPAITLSKINTISTLRKLDNIKLLKRINLNKALLILQFVFSMLFMMVVTTLHKQIRHLIDMDYGFDTSLVYNLPLQGISYELAKSKFSTIPGVEKISALDAPMGTYYGNTIKLKIKKEDVNSDVNTYSIDSELLPNLKLDLVAGENFAINSSTKEFNHQILVNELFADRYKLGKGSEVIGKVVYINDTVTATIRGVVKDYLFKPADIYLEPLVLQNVPSEWKLLNIKLSSTNTEQTISSLQSGWNEIAPGYEFKGEFYNAVIKANFTIYHDVGKVIQFFTLLGIVIGMMGLLGIIIYTVEKKQKEISIRKVVGASGYKIIVAISKSFLLLLVFGFVISIPIGVFLSRIILDNFASRISPGLNIVLPGFIILSGLALVIIGSQTIKASVSSPIKALRSE